MKQIPFQPVIDELVCKFREIPFEILDPAFRIRQMEVMDDGE